MSYDYLKGHKCMAWTFMGNSRMYQALAAYGDRLSQVGLFSFKVSRTGIITESGVAISCHLDHNPFKLHRYAVYFFADRFLTVLFQKFC